MAKTSKWKITLQQKGQLPNIKKHMGEIMSAVAEAARNEWIRLAREKLSTTVRTYIDAIGQPDIKQGRVEIKLTGWLPNAIEDGSGPFDMKPGLLRGPNVKRDSKGRPYNTVPFGLKSPGSKGLMPPVMPQSIYRLAAQMKFDQRLSLPTKVEGYGMRTRLSPDASRWGNYSWKSSPFQGITKFQRFPGELPNTPAGKLPSYKTFRRVSKRSDPSSWTHPGFQAKNLIEASASKLEQKFPEIINKILGE